MTQTINEMRTTLAEMEEIAVGMVALHPTTHRQMVKAMTEIFDSAVGAELLELALKGALPELAYPRISRAVSDAIKATRERILDHPDAQVPGFELPEARQ